MVLCPAINDFAPHELGLNDKIAFSQQLHSKLNLDIPLNLFSKIPG